MAVQRGDIETNLGVRTLDACMTPEEYRQLPKNPLWFVLDNLRSAFNVGAIFRLCDAMRVEGLLLCGYTASPPHVKLAKTSLGTIDYVPWRKFGTTAEAVAWLRQQKIEVWAAETCDRAERFDRVQWPSQVAIVLGNEALGVDRHILAAVDRIVEIPLYGFKNSVNVATACAVLGFKFLETRAVTRTTTALRPHIRAESCSS